MSFCALDSNNVGDSREWLTYWVIFGLFNGIEYISWFIPFYYIIKLITLIWLFHPKYQGASLIYNNYIKQYEELKNDEEI